VDAWASLIEHVAEPAVSGVVEVHIEPVQLTEPVGVPLGPPRVAMKTNVPPVEVLSELSVTFVVVVALSKVTVVWGEKVMLKLASAALVAVTRHVPADVEVSWPEETAQPEAVPFTTA
jgi:hypothetical protein